MTNIELVNYEINFIKKAALTIINFSGTKHDLTRIKVKYQKVMTVTETVTMQRINVCLPVIESNGTN
jgi:hypothetical protein